MNERLDGWAKVLAVAIPLAVTGFVAVVLLFGRMASAEDALAEKANRETVAAQYQAVTVRLDGIERALVEIQRELRAQR